MSEFTHLDSSGNPNMVDVGANSAPIKGLVLAGGHSTRMGRDKGLLEWHGKPQREYLVDLFESVGLEAHISCRPDQVDGLAGYHLVVDQEEGQGPLGAINSAFLKEPGTAWLVVACDMPFLNRSILQFLVEHRQQGSAATAFRAPAFSDGSPDPLFAIWEPAIAGLVAQRLAENRRCARKILMEAGVHILDAPDPGLLSNINTPQEAHAIIP